MNLLAILIFIFIGIFFYFFLPYKFNVKEPKSENWWLVFFKFSGWDVLLGAVYLYVSHIFWFFSVLRPTLNFPDFSNTGFSVYEIFNPFFLIEYSNGMQHERLLFPSVIITILLIFLTASVRATIHFMPKK